MDDFFKVFSLVLIALCIVNLISSIYPATKSKHTLMVVFSIISVYLCITPVSSLLNSIHNFESFSVESVIEDFENDSVDKNYTDELKSILEAQIEAEIEARFKNVDAKAVLGVKNTAGGENLTENDRDSIKIGETESNGAYENVNCGDDEKSGNASLEVLEIIISGAGNDEEELISEYVGQKYKITPIFREDTGF